MKRGEGSGGSRSDAIVIAGKSRICAVLQALVAVFGMC